MRVFGYRIVFLLCVVLMWGCSNGCAGTTKHADKSLSTVLAATTAARDSFVAWDAQQQTWIVEQATTREEGEARLKNYRDKRQKVLKAFTIAYQSLASAAAVMPLVERGERKESEFESYLRDALNAILVIKEAIQGST